MEFKRKRKQTGITTRYNDEILDSTQPSGIEENAFAFVPNWCNLFSAMHWVFIPTYIVHVLVWHQWWSFADVSQQGIDFSKKISKIKIFFWFDFHKCSHGPSKIRRHFRNKSRSILKLSKNLFYKKCGPKLIFFDDIFFKKNSNVFWHRKRTLKVRFRHFLTTRVNICESQIKKIFLFYWFFY